MSPESQVNRVAHVPFKMSSVTPLGGIVKSGLSLCLPTLAFGGSMYTVESRLAVTSVISHVIKVPVKAPLYNTVTNQATSLFRIKVSFEAQMLIITLVLRSSRPLSSMITVISNYLKV